MALVLELLFESYLRNSRGAVSRSPRYSVTTFSYESSWVDLLDCAGKDDLAALNYESVYIYSCYFTLIIELQGLGKALV